MAPYDISFLSRRDFLKAGAGFAAVTATAPIFLAQTAHALTGGGGRGDGRILVVIQLSGGNDGLNTVVPYADDAYYRARPSLALPAKDLLKLNDTVALHPNLAPLKALYDDGLLSIVQGVGYPNPDRSHFRSMEIWQSGVVEGFESKGWIGRLFDHNCGNGHLDTGHACSPSAAVNIGDTLNPALNGDGVGIALRDPEQFYRMTRLMKQGNTADTDTVAKDVGSPLDFLRRTATNAALSADRVRRSVRRGGQGRGYPRNQFAKGLELIASMIGGGMDTRVYYTSLGGFDTHANQKGQHANLMKTLAEGIGAFQKDLDRRGVSDRVLTFTFSEFGRRVKENGSRGTDHGQAASLFVFGKGVKPGIVGAQPSLEKLNGGDLIYHTDFRRVYASVIDKWLKDDAAKILGATFKPLPILKG